MVRGGLSFREAHYLCEVLGETGLVSGLARSLVLFGYEVGLADQM